MALISFWCRRLGDLIGQWLKAFFDDRGDYVQPVLILDENGNRAGTQPNPLTAILGDASEITQFVHDDLNANANAQIDETDADMDNPVPVQETSVELSQEAYALSYTDDLVTQVDMTIGVATYQRAFGYTDGQWTSAGAWVTV